MTKRNLYILIAVIAILVIAIGIYFYNKSSPLMSPAFCYDSDNGLNYNVKGNCSDKYYPRGVQDICWAGVQQVKEMYCNANKQCQSQKYTCPNGCSDGACITNTSRTETNQTNQTGGVLTLESNGTTSKQVNVSGKIYNITLVSASATSAMIKVTNSSNKSEQKEITEGYTKAVNGVNISVISADLSGSIFRATINVTSPPTNVTNQTGSLSVTSSPSSANLYVDEAYKGLTPYNVSGLSVGNHAIKLSKTGYQNFTNNTYVYAGQTTNLYVNLVAG